MNSGLLPDDILRNHCPQNSHISIEINTTSDTADRVDISIALQLDPSKSKEEREACPRLHLENNNLDLHYSACCNISDAHKSLKQLVEGIFEKGPIRRLIDADELRVDSESEPDLCSTQLKDLAAEGACIFRKLFGPQLDYEGISRADRNVAYQAFLQAITRPQRISIHSVRPLFPWTLLFDDLTFDRMAVFRPKLNSFWGMKHQIRERVKWITNKNTLPRNSKIIAAICPLIYPNFSSTEQYFGVDKDKLENFQIESITSSHDLRDSLSAFSADALYFLGHAKHQLPVNDTTSKLVLQNVELSVADIKYLGGVSFQKSPVLVFLNGCSTQVMDIWNERTIPGLLCACGDSGVCCVLTTAPVPKNFAREFGRRVWQEALAGKTLGESILNARRSLLLEYKNPLGLAYTLLGRLDTQFR